MKRVKPPVITVAIPTYNRGEVLFQTIDDIMVQTVQDFELLIIDQTDSEDALYFKKIQESTRDSRIRYFRVAPPSVTTARNFALLQARAEIIVFLDDDVRLDPRLLASYLDTFKEIPSLSAIGGRVMQEGYPIMKEILHFDDYAISHGVFTSKVSGYTNAFAGGNCALVVKDALAVGGFDTRYRDNSFREESDMSLKMSRAGMKIYYEARAELLHLAAPRGGNRVSGDIWDTFGTYKNELFFTMRYVRKDKLLTALRKKYNMYCLQVRHFRAYKRRMYFIFAVPTAIFRLLLVRQRVAKEVSL